MTRSYVRTLASALAHSSAAASASASAAAAAASSAGSEPPSRGGSTPLTRGSVEGGEGRISIEMQAHSVMTAISSSSTQV